MRFPPALFDKIQKYSAQKNIHDLLTQIHSTTPDVIAAGRNVLAGYIRAEGLVRGDFIDFVRKDHVYREALFLAYEKTSVPEISLANLFFILKYGMSKLSGDVVACGDQSGAAALFMTHIVRSLGLPTTVHKVNAFQKSQEEIVAVVKKNSQKNIILAHIACHTYGATKYALAAVQPLMSPAGGYLVIDHATSFSSSLEVFQAVEEMVQEQDLHAEQASPHLVYRVPRISCQLPEALS